jgi:hypothetical protein
MMHLVIDWYANVNGNWRKALNDEGFRRYFPLNLLVCFVVYYAIMFWLNFNSGRAGLIINDPVYGYLVPHDFSAAIFFFTYTATILTILYTIQYPYLLQRGLGAFVAVFLVRAICIHLIPLSPSPGIIPLIDPVTDTLGHEGRIMNDLFFSGHVSDLATFYFLCRNPKLKRYILLCMSVIAVLLVWQRVHYTIDVLVAPAFSYLSYWVFIEKDFIWKHFLKQPQFGQNPDHFLAEE